MGLAVGKFLADAAVSEALLDIGLAGTTPDASWLEKRWTAIDGPHLVQNIRFDFGWGMLAFQQGLTEALISESSPPDSPLANQVIVSRLVTLQRQVEQVTQLLERQVQSQLTAPTQPPAAVTSTAALPFTQFHSCFISYSSKDYAFVERLYDDLVTLWVSCWFAAEDLVIGAKTRQAIDEAIWRQDKLLLVLSQNSIASAWVEVEAEAAFDMEAPDKLRMFPIRLDDAVMPTHVAWAAHIRRTRHIGDFRNWQDDDGYQRALTCLLRDPEVRRYNSPMTAIRN